MPAREPEPIIVGRYVLHRPLARGGMATIHLAHLVGDIGFSRIVAAKRLLPELAGNGEFVTMFLDEARVASKVHHRNVVPVLDVVTTGGEVVLVQEYVRGAPLSRLLQLAADARSHVPVPVAASIACQVLAGLHAAHETVDEMGTPLYVVHRDVTPQNIMVATDGTARLLDFGVAKAAMAAHVTRKGTFKGKLAYSAPEHLRGAATRQSDVYSLAVVLWELLAGQRLHRASLGITRLIERITSGEIPALTGALAAERALFGGHRWQQLEALEPIVHKGLAADPRERWATAQDMEEAIAGAVPIAAGAEIADWLGGAAREFLDERERAVAEEEASWRRLRRLGSPKPEDLADLAIPVDGAGSGFRPPAAGLLRARTWLSQIARELRGLRLARTSPRIWIGAAAVVVLGVVLALAIPGSHAVPAPRQPGPPVVAPIATPPAIAQPVTPHAPRPQAPPVRHVPARPRPHASPPPHHTTRVVRPASTPVPARPVPARPESRKPAIDCNPPYYFRGAKKTFKPACV